MVTTAGIAAVERGIRVTVEDSIATLMIDQPGSRVNVMNIAFIEDLEHALDALPGDVRGLVVASGKEGNFIAGADLEQVRQAPTADDASEQVRRLHRALNRLADLPYPTVAAINGAALGGGLEVALACDWRVCVATARSMRWCMVRF